VQERIEASAVGRAFISAFVVVTIVGLIFWNLPQSKLRRQGLSVLGPYVRAVGLDQNWGVFAPDPRRTTLDFRARVQFADGTTEMWRVPRGGDLFGAYWDYRWLKWMEWATMDVHRQLWAPAADFIARDIADGRRPTRIQLIRRWYELPPPGSDRPRSSWQVFTFYDERLVQVEAQP
jgi:hypothetical protein